MLKQHLIILTVKAPGDWTDFCTHLRSSSRSLCSLHLYHLHTDPHLANFQITLSAFLPANIPARPPLGERQFAPATPPIRQFSFKWICFASAYFLLYIFQGCGFYWSLLSQGCWWLDGGTQQKLLGLRMAVRPAGSAVLGFERCQAQQIHRSPASLSENAC